MSNESTPGTRAAKERGRGHTDTHTELYSVVMKQASWEMKMRWSDSKSNERRTNHYCYFSISLDIS